MEENKDKRINAQSGGLGDETIVFRRQQVSSSAQPKPSDDMQNTAKLQGGAVIRPLKSQTPQRPHESVQKQKPTQSQTLTPMQQAQKRQQMLRQQQTTQPAQPTQRAQGTSAVKPQVPPQQQKPVQPSAQRPLQQRPSVQQSQPLQQRPVTPQTRVPQSPAQPKSVQNNAQAQRPVNIPPQRTANTSGLVPSNSVVSSGRTGVSKSNLPAAKPQPQKRTENDDFEIDERTWARKAYLSKRDSAFVDSATSAVMSLVKAMIYIVAVIAVAVGISVFIINTGNDVFKFVVDEKMVTVTIPEYASIEDVSDALYDSGAIKYKWAFNFWSKLKDSGAEFIPGTYEVSTSLNYDYLRASFKESTRRTEVRITIPEGYTVDEIIDKFVDNGIGTRDGFVDAIQNYDFDYPFLEGLEVRADRIYRLEGYLFPDTYNFYQDSSEVAVLTKLLDNFNRKFVEEYYNRCIDLNMTVDQAIILASMVESETRFADELGYVSSVFHNRLKYSASFPYLNSDATIMYAMHHDLGGRPDNMSGDDTKYETPYNTYTNKGLPPGPIYNPGLNSIKYALYPNESNYFYFVSDSVGRMLFATTEADHIKNINTARGN